MSCPRVRAVIGALLVVFAAPASAADKPVKVFVLAGQSNMEGHGFVPSDPKRNEGKGSLEYITKQPATADQFKHLRGKDGKWAVRDDVRHLQDRAPFDAKGFIDVSDFTKRAGVINTGLRALAAQQARPGAAYTLTQDGLGHALAYSRVLRQSQIVVRRKIDAFRWSQATAQSHSVKRGKPLLNPFGD